MIIFGFIIKRASTLKAQIQKGFDAKENGSYYNEKILWQIVGIYEARLFGMVIYRDIYSNDRLVKELEANAKRKNQ